MGLGLYICVRVCLYVLERGGWSESMCYHTELNVSDSMQEFLCSVF